MSAPTPAPGIIAGPVHAVTVHLTAYRHAEAEPEVRYDIVHPLACNQLPYGRLCDLDALLGQFGYVGCGMPTVPGTYCVNYWRSVPDADGRYRHGVAVTLAPPLRTVPPMPPTAPAASAGSCPPPPASLDTGDAGDQDTGQGPA